MRRSIITAEELHAVRPAVTCILECGAWTEDEARQLVVEEVERLRTLRLLGTFGLLVLGAALLSTVSSWLGL